jgi:hypothetical protein
VRPKTISATNWHSTTDPMPQCRSGSPMKIDPAAFSSQPSCAAYWEFRDRVGLYVSRVGAVDITT